MQAVVTVIACSVCVGFVFVLVATGSLRIGACCLLTILAIVACWVGIAVCGGMLSQGLGMVESVVMMTSVMASCDDGPRVMM